MIHRKILDMLKINIQITSLVKEAEGLKDKGDYKSAIEKYDEAIKLAPRNILCRKKELIVKKLNLFTEDEENITKLIKPNTEFKIPKEKELGNTIKLLENEKSLNELRSNLKNLIEDLKKKIEVSSVLKEEVKQILLKQFNNIGANLDKLTTQKAVIELVEQVSSLLEEREITKRKVQNLEDYVHKQITYFSVKTIAKINSDNHLESLYPKPEQISNLGEENYISPAGIVDLNFETY